VKTRVRLHLLLQLLAVAVASSLVLVAVGIPLLASRALGPREFLVLVGVGAAAVVAAGAFVLFRWVGRPLDRLLVAEIGRAHV